MPLPTSIRIVVRAVQQFGADGAAAKGAALAYYALFSVAPLLVLAVSVAGLVFGEEAARQQVTAYLNDMAGPETAEEIGRLMQQYRPFEGGALATALSLAVLLAGALGAFLHLRNSLAAIWRLEPIHHGFFGTIFNYLLAVVMVLVVALLLLLSLAASTALAVLIAFFEHWFPGGGPAWQALEFAVSLGLLTLLFAAIFRILSARRIAWRHVWYGAAVGALLFTIGKTLLGYYFAYTSTASIYGAAGSLVVFLVWVYYSAQILFFAAEMVQARRTRSEWIQ